MSLPDAERLKGQEHAHKAYWFRSQIGARYAKSGRNTAKAILPEPKFPGPKAPGVRRLAEKYWKPLSMVKQVQPTHIAGVSQRAV